MIKYIIYTMCRWCHGDGCPACNWEGFIEEI